MYKLVCVFLCVASLTKGDVSYSIFPSLPVVLEKSDNVVCKRHNEEYLDNLKNFTLWAYESE